MILTVLLVILTVVSMLYCLGFASLVLRDSWQRAPLPWSEEVIPNPDLEIVPTLQLVEPTFQATSVP